MNTEQLLNPVLSDARENLGQLQSQISGKTRQLTEMTDCYVHENPWRTIAIAAIVGCVIGFLLRPQKD